MRAYSNNEDLALLSGIDPSRVVMITWIIASILATVAGTLYGLDKSFKPFTYFNNLLPIFAAAIVGGIGNPIGAFFGGFLVDGKPTPSRLVQVTHQRGVVDAQHFRGASKADPFPLPVQHVSPLIPRPGVLVARACTLRGLCTVRPNNASGQTLTHRKDVGQGRMTDRRRWRGICAAGGRDREAESTG